MDISFDTAEIDRKVFEEEDMSKLIILRGNSGSGKTTVAKALQKKLGYNTMLISQDEVRRNMLWLKMA